MVARSLNAYKRPYLDSCVYIAAVKGPKSDEAAMAEVALRIISAAERGDFQIVATSIVRAEVVKPRRGSGPTSPEDVDRIDQVLTRSSIVWVEADVPLCAHAQELQLRYRGLKPMDAIHIAGAIRGRADYLLTTDPVLLNAGISEIRVQAPTYQGQEELDIDGATERPVLPPGD